MSERGPDRGARRALALVLVLTPVVALATLAFPGLDVTARSVILIAWMAIMITVLRRTG